MEMFLFSRKLNVAKVALFQKIKVNLNFTLWLQIAQNIVHDFYGLLPFLLCYFSFLFGA